MADEFDDAFHRLDQQRALTALSVTRPAPDAAGKANAIARETGVPADTADRNLSALEQQVQFARARAVMDANPTVANWASNPRNAAVGADDMGELAKNAAYWRSAATGTIKATPDAPTSVLGVLKGIYTDFVETGREAIQATQQQFADAFPNVGSFMRQPGVPQLASNPTNYGDLYRRAEARKDAAAPQFKSALGRGLYGGASSLAQMLPVVGISLATKNPGLGIAMIAAQQGQPAYAKYRSRGATPGMAALGGGLEGTAEAAGELLPLGFLVNKIGKAGAKEFIAGFLGRELPSELATTLAQNITDTAIANPTKTWGQFAKEQPDALVQTAIGTLVAGGAFGALNHVGKRFADEADRSQALDNAAALDKAMAASGESKTRARDPEAFKQLVGLHTDGTDLENMFVPAEKVATYFQQQGTDYRADSYWGKYADQIDEGLMSGGDVVIPTADAAAHLAGTPAWDHIRPDVRTSPGGASIAETEALAADREQTMQDFGASVSEEMNAAREADAPRAAVYQDIRDKLTNAGYTQDAAHLNAELVAQRYATRAERLGQPLRGDETANIAVNSVLPANLAPIVAADPERVALKSVINVMRRARGVKTSQGLSLLDWIAKNGGIEDRGGDIASMGGAEWHRGKPGRRKLIREAANLNQGSMLSDGAQQNANTPDELAVRAQEAGYLPAGDRPTVNDLLEAVGGELRGTPRFAETPDAERTQAAADELAQILDQSGLDPAKATDSEITGAIDAYRQAASGSYQQTFADGPRGQITFNPNGTSVIDLFQSRNLSTFAHEMGHQWLEELRADATRPDAPDQLKADWQTVQDWFAENGHAIAGGKTTADILGAQASPIRVGDLVKDTSAVQRAYVISPNGKIYLLNEGVSHDDFATEAGTADLSGFAAITTFGGELALRRSARPSPAQNRLIAQLTATAVRGGRDVTEGGLVGNVGVAFPEKADATPDAKIPVEAHELWARGVERFLMEGKAPSTVLRRVFDTFKAWMLQIYQVSENLNAPISQAVRTVMKRMMASDAEIAAVEQRDNVTALFTDAAQAGMSEAEFAAYQAVAQQSKDEAHEALLFRTMAAIRRERTKAWQDEERNVRDDVTSRINRRPEFKALHLLRTGRTLDLPDAEPIKVKLDKAWLLSEYGEGILSSLPKGVPPIFSETNTTNADDIAEMVGFRTGDEMVRTLITMQERTQELRDAGDKRSLRQALVDEEVSAEMLDRHGDILNDGSIEEEAIAAVHNDQQGEVIAAEMRSLGRRSGRQPTPYSLAKEWARTKIAESTVQDATSGASIQRYARAAAKASKAAEKAMLAGDIDETYRQKQAEMLNTALVAEAGRMRDAVVAARDRLAGYARRRTIKSMDQDYLERIHELLEQVEFKNRSQTSIERQGSFEEWARAREAEGHDVIVPLSFASTLGSTNWTRLTVEKLLGLDDAVQQVAHLGRLKQKLIDGKEQREFEEVIGEALAGIDNLPPRPPVEFDPSWSDRMKGKVDSIDAGLLKMETIVDWLDGGNSNGVFNRIAFRPIAEAQAREQDMTADYFGRIRQHMEAVTGIERWAERVIVPELMDRETGRALSATRQRLVAMALNVGNEGNVQRLTDGYGWNRDTVMSVLNRELTVEDWRFVQNVWDTIDTLWPDISAMERRVNGVEPEKVDATPVETIAGTLRGGYYPAIYDKTRDLQAERNAGAGADLLESNYTRATTRASATKDRAAKVKRPILLEVGVINRHLGEVIHDITHREAIINAHQFLSDTRVQKAVNNTLGPEIRKQFRPWLKHVANQWASERSGNEGLAGFMRKARANTTAVGMGFRLSTVITQVAGYSNSQEVLGGTWLPQAIAQSTAHPVETFRFVSERSGEIRHRMETMDRDIGQLMRSLDLNPLAKGLDVARQGARFMYHGIGYADRLVVIPTWVGAYNKALAGGLDEQAAIYAADKVVRQSQGSGGAKDLAAIQRGTGNWGEALKLSTMFYSYFSALYQRQRSLGREVAGATGQPRDLPAVMARAMWLVIIPPVLSQLIAGKGPGEDDDWGIWSFKQMLFNALAPIPFVRDLAQPIWDKAAGNRSFGYQLSPVQRAGDTLVNVAGDASNIVQGKDTKQATRDTLEATGYVTGLVPGQVATATQFLVDVGYGDQDPDTAMEWYRGLSTGKAEPRKP